MQKCKTSSRNMGADKVGNKSNSPVFTLSGCLLPPPVVKVGFWWWRTRDQERGARTEEQGLRVRVEERGLRSEERKLGEHNRILSLNNWLGEWIYKLAAESLSQSQIGCKCQIYESDKVNAWPLPTLVSYLNMIKDKCKFQLRVHSCKTDTGRKMLVGGKLQFAVPQAIKRG